MPFPKCKVYSDGSHFIGIPHTTRPFRPRRAAYDEVILVDNGEILRAREMLQEAFEALDEEIVDVANETAESGESFGNFARQMTRRELFDELYAGSADLPRKKRRDFLVNAFVPYFPSRQEAAQYVDEQIRRKTRNLVLRRVRVSRKVNLNEFNYFCTFTYNGKLLTEQDFRKKLRYCLSDFSRRHGWKYMGVWERSPKKRRLHFHGLFYIPAKTMPGKLVEVKDYSVASHRVQTTIQNTYFNDRFGRSDFQLLDPDTQGQAVRYLLKYLEKTKERIVFSKNLPDHFVSDILDDDVVCGYGVDDRKLLLRDNFKCFKDWEYLGTVSRAVIQHLDEVNKDMA